MNKGFEINGTMDLGHMSPLEQQENVMEKKINEQTLRQIVRESLKELSNQTIGSYMRATKNQRRDRQYDAGKWHAIKTVNDKYSFCITLDLGEEVLFTLGMENEEFFILADVDEHMENKEPYTLKLMANNPRRMLDGTPITETTVGYVIDNLRAGERMKLKGLCQSAMELNQALKGKQAQVAESVKEKAVSKSQQRFFGMVDAYKKGELDDASKAVKDAAEGMSMKQVKDFAKTKHKGLPNHVDESVLRSIIRETLEQIWVDREPKDEMDNIRLQRYHGLVEIVEYYLNQCEAGNSVELSDKQREQLEDACNKLCVFGEIGEKWANLGRSILSGNEDVVEEKPFTDENVYTMDDWRRDGSLKVQIGQLIAPEVYWQLRDSVPPMSDGGCFQPGEAYDHDWRTGKALYQTFTREGNNYYRYKGLQPASRWGLKESKLKKIIRETVQTHLVNVLGKYTQGKVSSKEANKAIMDLANSSNQKKKTK